MHIVLLIGNFTKYHKGEGGHYYTVQHLYETLNKYISISICCVGQQLPMLYNNNPKVDFVELDDNNNYFKDADLIYNYLCNKYSEANIKINSFDKHTTVIAQFIAYKYNIPFICTKPGMGIPKRFFPIVNNIILFSQADIRWFSNKFFKPSNIYYLPNRINPNILKDVYDKTIEEFVFGNSFVFIRIGRINEKYHNINKRCIEFIEELNKHNLNCKLIMIGNVVSNDSFRKLIKAVKCDNNYLFLTDNYRCTYSSKYIHYADAVLGTGRGFMEGTLKNKLMYSFADNCNFPVLVKPNKDYFNLFFEENFSGRTILRDGTNYDPVRETTYIISNNLTSEIKKRQTNLFSSNFDIDVIINDYIKIYSDLSNKNDILSVIPSLLWSKLIIYR